MNRILRLRLSSFLRKYAIPCLACSWILGLISGLWAVRFVDFDLPGLEDSFHSYTLFGVISVALLPVLISTMVVFVERSWLLLPFSFLKAFSFAYVGSLVTGGYGSAGWLIQSLLMFSDCLSLPFLWWFWCRLLKSAQQITFSTIFHITLVAFSIGVLDFKVISPFLSLLQILQKG